VWAWFSRKDLSSGSSRYFLKNSKSVPLPPKSSSYHSKGLIDKTQIFDEKPELDFYYLWHHERQGVAMFAPDYAWWHGFYDMKERYNDFMEYARDLIKHNKKAYKVPDYPNATGKTTRPPGAAPITR
jgi:hypothetical protein